MNHDDPRHRSPPRAQPLQPDQPGQGSGKQDEGSGAAPDKGEQRDVSDSAKKLKEQSEVAVENTSEGYGGGR